MYWMVVVWFIFTCPVCQTDNEFKKNPSPMGYQVKLDAVREIPTRRYEWFDVACNKCDVLFRKRATGVSVEMMGGE